MPFPKPDCYPGIKRLNVAVTICLLGASICLGHGDGVPRVLSAAEAAKELSSSNALACGSLLFYNNKLYASAAAGLLEIENGSITKIYRWGKDYSGLEGLWQDNANGLLWVCWSDNERDLTYYDGRTWREVKFPKPQRGYFSREDVLHGFRGVSNNKAFWLEGAGRAWRWQGAKSGKWTEVSLPLAFHPEKEVDLLVRRVIPTEGTVFFVKRGDSDWDWRIALMDDPRMQNRPNRSQVDAKIQGDSVWYSASGQWTSVPNNEIKFFTLESTGVNNKAYLRTTKGDLFEVAEASISKLKIPGVCEAIAPSADGTLLASFHGLGVYELKEDWHKLLESPYSDSERDFKVRLAAQQGCIALAISPQSQSPLSGVKPFTNAPSPWVYNSRPRIWISKGPEWKPISAPAVQ